MYCHTRSCCLDLVSLHVQRLCNCGGVITSSLVRKVVTQFLDKPQQTSFRKKPQHIGHPHHNRQRDGLFHRKNRDRVAGRFSTCLFPIPRCQVLITSACRSGLGQPQHYSRRKKSRAPCYGPVDFAEKGPVSFLS